MLCGGNCGVMAVETRMHRCVNGGGGWHGKRDGDSPANSGSVTGSGADVISYQIYQQKTHRGNGLDTDGWFPCNALQ